MDPSTRPGTPVVTPATDDDFELLGRLLQLYLHDFSEFTGQDVNGSGRYHYAYLGAYRHEDGRRAFVIRVDDRPAGFALVRFGEQIKMAEFFVLRKYRRGGVGTLAARALFEQLPGTWSINELATNRQATEFWHRAIPVPFEERTHPDGRVEQVFTMTRGS